jgi:hypothetical protein
MKANRDHVKIWLKDIISVKEIKAILDKPSDMTDKFLKYFLSADDENAKEKFHPF